MKKRLVLAIILAVMAACLLFNLSFAHDRNEHNRDLRCVLFGPPCTLPSNTENIKTAMKRLYYAMYLSIDQFTVGENTGNEIVNGREELAYLRQQKIKWLPRNIKTINLNAKPSTHRSFTHLGWDWNYDKDEANWPARKMILLSTVNDTFKFKITGNNPDNYKGKCDSFAALIYYVHLIGDHIENKKPKAEGLEMNLGGTRDGINIINDLKKHLEILFSDQKSTGTYSSMMGRLDKLNERMYALVTKQGGIRPDIEADIQEYHDCAEELLKILKLHVPYLLRNEDFFKLVFY